jgi:hypothetical protein
MLPYPPVPSLARGDTENRLADSSFRSTELLSAGKFMQNHQHHNNTTTEDRRRLPHLVPPTYCPDVVAA